MKKGFTLVELLVVIAIISLLSTIALAALNTAREKARITAGLLFDSHVYHSIGDRLIQQYTFDDGTIDSYPVYNGEDDGTFKVQGVTGNGEQVIWYQDDILIKDRSLANQTGALTVSEWVKPFDPVENDYIAARGRDAGGTYSDTYFWRLGYYGDNKIIYALYSLSSGLGNFCQITATVPDFVPEGWNHLLGSYDGAGKISLYVNGKQVSGTQTGQCTGKYLDPPNGLRSYPLPWTEIWLGGGSDSEGAFDNLRIYDAAYP